MQAHPKQLRKVLTCDSSYRFQFPSMKRRKTSRRLHNPHRFIAFPPKWYRCQVWTIGFDQQSIERKLSRHIAQILRLFKSQIACERDEETEFDCGLSHRQTAAKTVHDSTASVTGQCFAKDRDRVRIRFAR